ncbi:restriction endonuclease subunit S [Deltaproteobacteria bacterium Smac51]|nr:restriction endonuclease subunit S [Deltaproteobacteria bacterium Smac51]
MVGQEKTLDEIGSGYTYFANNDILVAKITPCFENGKGAHAMNLTNCVGFGSTEFHVIRSIDCLSPRFLFYVTISHLFRKRGESFMYGAGGQKRIPDNYVKDFFLPTPPISEQYIIAAFLDHECARIDELIEKKRRLLALLEEKRRAVITQTVTHGLDRNAPMKDSGVEWMGQIPQEWEIKRLKYIGLITLGLTYSPEEVSHNGYGTLVLRSSNIQQGKLSFTDLVFVDKKIPKKLKTRQGDILVCTRNGSRALIGKNAIITAETGDATFGVFMSIIRSPFYQYLYWVLNSNLFEYKSGSYLTSTINQLTIQNLNSFEVPFPKWDEQQAIVAYLNAATAAIDAKRQAQERSIGLLQEYRASLITHAVTGKIDVRDFQPAHSYQEAI